jgi:hypothetical protein
MYKLIGKKETFAVEIANVVAPPKWESDDFWIKSAIWINSIKLGEWEDINLVGIFLRSMYRIARQYETFWVEELEGLNCKELFLTIHPNYNDTDSFYDLPEEEQARLTQFDKFLINWGENFADWILSVIYKNGLCKFLWVCIPLRGDDSYEVRNNIQCFDVKLEQVQEVYNDLIKIIPDKDWPSLIPK